MFIPSLYINNRTQHQLERVRDASTFTPIFVLSVEDLVEISSMPINTSLKTGIDLINKIALPKFYIYICYFKKW